MEPPQSLKFGSHTQNRAWLPKIGIIYWGVKGGDWKSSRSCIWILFLLLGVEIGLIFALRQRFLRHGPIFKMAISRHETWNLKKVPEVAQSHILFLSHGIEIFALRVELSEIRADLPISIFGHETWPLVKFSQVAHTFSFYTRGRNWAYFRLTGSGFRAAFQNFHIYSWNLGFEERSQSWICTFFLPMESGVHESSLPVAHPGYQVLSDILFRLGLLANALTQCSS